MLTFVQSLVFILFHIIEVSCSGPDFSDIRYLGNNGYHLPSQGLYRKIYGGSGKRYGVHFPGPNEGYGLHNAHDKDPGGIDYKEFGWNANKYIYPRIVPARHHYDGNAVYDDPSHGSVTEKEKAKINPYIYSFDEASTKSENKRYGIRKETRGQDKISRKWKKIKEKRRSQHYRSQDPYEIYEPVKKEYAHYDDNSEAAEISDKKDTEEDEDDAGDEYSDTDNRNEDSKDYPVDDQDDEYRAVILKRQLSKTYDVSAGACGNIYILSGYCWGKEPQLYRHPNPICYIQCDNMGNTFIRMCAKGTLWRAKYFATYNACV